MSKKLVEEKINNLRNSMIKRYLNEDIEELTRDLSIEENDVNSYHGREILELLQNIDDAYELSVQSGTVSSPVEAEISFVNGVLRVSNTGTSFDFDGIKSIVLGHLSTKDKTLIGSKGSGFRSVLNWSNDIRIYSGDYNIGFSREYANLEYDKIKNNNSIIRQEQMRKKRGENALTFPIFSMPKIIPNKNISEYTTTIEIIIDQDKNKDDYNVINQLREFDYRTLLFLPNLYKLTIKIEDELIIFTKESKKIGNIDEVIIINGNNHEKFYVLKKEIDIENIKKYIVVAAPIIPLDDYPIYSYFPTKQKFHLPLLVHAPFILSQDRNRIITDIDGYNKLMFTKILDESISLAIELTKAQDNKEFPLVILTPNTLDRNNWGFIDVIKDFNLLDYYLNALNDIAIIPLRNGGFTNLVNGIKIFDIPTPTCFKGRGFELLLENISNERSFNFVKRLLSRKGINTYFSSAELIKIINNKTLNLEERVETFIWWSNVYPTIKTLPNLIEIDNEYIVNSNNERIFLPSKDGISDLPSSLKAHVKLKIISQEFVDVLIDKLKTTNLWNEMYKQYSTPSDKRVLDKYSEEKFAIRFNEQSSREMIIREINNQVTTYEIAVEFLKWLYTLYKNGNLTSQSLKEINFNFPINDGFKKSSEIFIGSNWDNKIANKLFIKEKYMELESLELLGIPIAEKELFISFVTNFGVSKFPKFNLSRIDDSNFKKEIDKKHTRYIYSYTCDDFEELMKTLDTETILSWIQSDNFLISIITAIEENSYAQLQSNSPQEKFRSNAYILYVLNTTKWITINGLKYAPIEIVMFEKLADKIGGFYGISRTNLRKIVGDILFSELSFRKSFANFSDLQLKKIIIELSLSGDTSIAPKLYDDIVRGKRDQKPNEDEYNTKEFNLLCKDGKYYKADKIWYADKIVPRLYTNNPKNHFIHISPKLGTKTIFDWFGVKKFEVDLKFKSFEPMDNKEIENDIKQLKIALLASIDDNSNNIEAMKRLTIIPSMTLTVADEYDNEVIIEDDYYHVSNGSNLVYLKIPYKYDKLKVAPILTDIFRNALIYNFDESLIQLLLMFNKNQKIDYVTTEYGLEKWNISEEILLGYSNNKTKIINFFISNNLVNYKIDLLKKINFDKYLKHEDFPNLIDALKSVDADIKDLNNLDIFPNIDIRNYWQQKLKGFIISNLKKYKTIMFKKLETESVGEQKEYINIINEFESFEYNFNNTVNVDIENILFNSFNIKAGENYEYIDVDAIYIRNYEILKNHDDLFDDFISDNKSIKSLVYFITEDIIDLINKEYNKNKNINKDDFSNLEQRIINTEGEIINVPIAPKNKIKKPKVEKGAYSGKSKSQINKENKQKEVKGKQAEEIAYSLLSKRYSNLKWTSENAPSNFPERNTSTSYDMYYINAKNQKVFIEIKSSIGSFYMTSSEYELAVNQGESYEIWLVDVNNNKINGPKYIKDFESSKEATEYRFSYIHVHNNF